jgi:hypothetical protein
MSRVDISNIPPPNTVSGVKHPFRFQFMKLQEWRKHPALIGIPTSPFGKLHFLFPGFFQGLALFAAYVVLETGLTSLGYIGNHGHHEDSNHGHKSEAH